MVLRGLLITEYLEVGTIQQLQILSTVHSSLFNQGLGLDTCSTKVLDLVSSFLKRS